MPTDTERLDWLEFNEWELMVHLRQDTWIVGRRSWGGDMTYAETGSERYVGYDGPRAAIDAAMNADADQSAAR